jgi:hypothetical protein
MLKRFSASRLAVSKVCKLLSFARAGVYGESGTGCRYRAQTSSIKYFFAKTANWVKDGVPAQSADTPSAQLVLHPASLDNDTQVLARDKPWRYPATRGAFRAST